VSEKDEKLRSKFTPRVISIAKPEEVIEAAPWAVKVIPSRSSETSSAKDTPVDVISKVKPPFRSKLPMLRSPVAVMRKDCLVMPSS
jgi:hypothetical protein